MRIYQVKLFKITSTHDRVRTETIEGTCRELPAIDNMFLMSGPGLEIGTRILRTSPVKAIARVGDTLLFETRNSTYSLLIVDESDDEADNFKKDKL